MYNDAAARGRITGTSRAGTRVIGHHSRTTTNAIVRPSREVLNENVPTVATTSAVMAMRCRGVVTRARLQPSRNR